MDACLDCTAADTLSTSRDDLYWAENKNTVAELLQYELMMASEEESHKDDENHCLGRGLG